MTMGYSVHAARQRIEEIMSAAPEAANSDQMKALVLSVKKNISDIIHQKMPEFAAMIRNPSTKN